VKTVLNSIFLFTVAKGETPTFREQKIEFGDGGPKWEQSVLRWGIFRNLFPQSGRDRCEFRDVREESTIRVKC
jgi:hypothetical protein